MWDKCGIVGQKSPIVGIVGFWDTLWTLHRGQYSSRTSCKINCSEIVKLLFDNDCVRSVRQLEWHVVNMCCWAVDLTLYILLCRWTAGRLLVRSGIEACDLSWSDVSGVGWGSCERSGRGDLSGNLRSSGRWKGVGLWDVNYTRCNTTEHKTVVIYCSLVHLKHKVT